MRVRQMRLWIFRAENKHFLVRLLYLSKKTFAWSHVPYMCAHVCFMLCSLYTSAVLTITNLWKCHVFRCLLKCLVAQWGHVAIFCLPGDAVIQLYSCIYICLAKCQWSLNEVQDSVPDQQMLYNLKCPRASTAVFTEQEWAELAVYSWPCMSMVVMHIVCICVTAYII